MYFKVSSIFRLLLALFALVFSFLWFGASDHFSEIPAYANPILVALVAIVILFGVNFERHFFSLIGDKVVAAPILNRILCILIVVVASLFLFWYNKFLLDDTVGVYWDSILLKYQLYGSLNREHCVQNIVLVANLVALVTTIVYLIQLYQLSFKKK